MTHEQLYDWIDRACYSLSKAFHNLSKSISQSVKVFPALSNTFGPSSPANSPSFFTTGTVPPSAHLGSAPELG
jgi:hypothetical protein